jgi:hypothetical protein
LDILVAEKNKRSGVCYAATEEGIEVPVIDVTHPCFRVAMDARELAEATARALADVKKREAVPAAEQQRQLQELCAGSFLAPRIARAWGKVLDGMSTYFLKLGPDNLGEGYARAIDRIIAGSLPCLSGRLRLQNMARLMADRLAPLLAARPGRPLHLLNIAGGPGMDSLNAILLLREEHPDLLRDRPLTIHLMDPDAAGPAFGARAASSLQADGGPLHGLLLEVRHVPYNWSSPSILKELALSLRADHGIVAASSEGGLFEYGSDEHIMANLKALHQGMDEDAVMVGTVSRADGPARILNEAGGAAVILRGWDAFMALASDAGWAAAKVDDSPLSHDVALMPDFRRSRAAAARTRAGRRGPSAGAARW